MKKILFLIVVINILSIASCCTDEHKITGATDFDAFSLINGSQLSQVTGSFTLVANLDLEIAFNDIANPFANELYGTSCEFMITNPILQESISLVTDKDFLFDGETISAGSNLTDLETVLVDNTSESVGVIFGEAFVNASDFSDTDSYVFTIEFETNDGLAISNSISLDMKI